MKTNEIIGDLSLLKNVIENLERKVRILIIGHSLIPSIVLGVLKPLKKLENEGLVSLRFRCYAINRLSLKRDIEWCDVGVFNRSQEYINLKVLYQLKKLGKRVIYGIDDNFMEIPVNNLLGRFHRAAHRLHIMRRFYELSDIVQVHSEILKKQVIQYGGNPSFHHSYFDDAMINKLPIPLKNTQLIRIAYATTRIDDPRLESLFYSVLEKISEKYTSKIEIHVWKSLPLNLTKLANIKIHNKINNYEKFVTEFYSQGFDIGLAPSMNESFFCSKTNNKYREYGACRVAGIYSNLTPYKETVQNKITGLLVDNTIEAWIGAISLLIEDDKLRYHIVQNANRDVKKNYSFQNAISMWVETLYHSMNVKLNLPSWLLNINQKATVMVILRRKNKLRFSHYQLACSGIRVKFKTRHYNLLLTKLNINKYSVIIYLISTAEDLTIALNSIVVAKTAIIDLTHYSGTLKLALAKIANISSYLPISILLNKKAIPQENFNFHLNTVIIPICPLSNFDEMYSIDGQLGSLMDTIEKHLGYDFIPMTQDKLSTLSYHIEKFWKKICNKLFELWTFLNWSLGKPPM